MIWRFLANLQKYFPVKSFSKSYCVCVCLCPFLYCVDFKGSMPLLNIFISYVNYVFKEIFVGCQRTSKACRPTFQRKWLATFRSPILTNHFWTKIKKKDYGSWPAGKCTIIYNSHVLTMQLQSCRLSNRKDIWDINTYIPLDPKWTEVGTEIKTKNCNPPCH